MQNYALQNAVKQSSLFSSCDIKELDFVIKSFSGGEQLTNCIGGEASIGLIVKGSIQVLSVGINGTIINLSTLKQGDSFGISSIFANTGLTTILKCDKQATIAYLSRSNFMVLLANNKDLFVKYATLCNQKIAYLTSKIETLTLSSSKIKLANYLLKSSDKDDCVNLPCTKEQLAKTLGVSRATLFRELALLSHGGLIAINKSYIKILDYIQLNRILLDC